MVGVAAPVSATAGPLPRTQTHGSSPGVRSEHPWLSFYTPAPMTQPIASAGAAPHIPTSFVLLVPIFSADALAVNPDRSQLPRLHEEGQASRRGDQDVAGWDRVQGAVRRRKGGVCLDDVFFQLRPAGGVVSERDVMGREHRGAESGALAEVWRRRALGRGDTIGGSLLFLPRATRTYRPVARTHAVPLTRTTGELGSHQSPRWAVGHARSLLTRRRVDLERVRWGGGGGGGGGLQGGDGGRLPLGVAACLCACCHLPRPCRCD